MKTGADTLVTEFGLYTCKTCGMDFPLQVERHFTTYGTDREWHKHCVECCGKNDLADALASGKWTGYLTETLKDKPPTRDQALKMPTHYYTYKASNWPGTLSIPVPFATKSRHNFGGSVTHVWFRMPGDPYLWYGKQIGDNNQILRAKRTKKKQF